MSDHESDRVLHEHYAATRRIDARAASSFDDAWRSARARSGDRRRPVLRVLALAAVGAGVVAAIVLFVEPFWNDSFETPTLSEWRAPTDTFLEIPGTEWLRSVPTFETGLPGLTWEKPSQNPGLSPSRRLRS